MSGVKLENIGVTKVQFETDGLLVTLSDCTSMIISYLACPELIDTSLRCCLDWNYLPNTDELYWPRIGCKIIVHARNEIDLVCIGIENSSDSSSETDGNRLNKKELAQKYYVNSDSADCHYEPNAGSAVSMTPPYGDAVTVLKFDDGWACVRAYTKTAWVQKGHLSTRPPKARSAPRAPLEQYTGIEVGKRGGVFTRTRNGFRRYF